MSPVEVFATRIKVFNWQNCPSLLDFSLLRALIYRGSNLKGKGMD